MRSNSTAKSWQVGRTVKAFCAACFLLVYLALRSDGAGLLKPADGGAGPEVRIRSHRVTVTINNGFSRTEVDQQFTNESDWDMEAIYSFPLPKQASVAELSLWLAGHEVVGEVLEKEQARQLYEEEVKKGNDTALSEKNDFKTFDVNVGRVPAHGTVRVRLVYYQPLEIDLNVGRYVYPLAEGGVDEERIGFWAVDDNVEAQFSFRLTLQSAFPVKDVRVPDYQNEALITKAGSAGAEEGPGEVYEVRLESAEGANLCRDIVFYYRLDDTVPARVELIPYRAGTSEPGTFMAVLTPAASLRRIAEGTDWVFVLDVSGSMGGAKIATLADGVGRVLGKMSPNDRFRIVTFNDNARDLTHGFVAASPANVRNWIGRVKRIRAGGGTALFAGITEGYRHLDADRTTGVILVTDGVCNVGPTGHAAFLNLLRKHDLRLFTFVLGNSANQPLMERLALESGGFAMNICAADDIVGRLLQAKAKVLHECMHDVRLTFDGGKVSDLTPARIGNVFAGQQIVVFGHYTDSGAIELTLNARVAGERRAWTCRAVLPETDTANPELERLWALSRIDELMQEIREKGETPERRRGVVDLGVAYSLVTDYTSMLVLREEVMEAYGIDRRNAQRVHRERTAQRARAAQPARNYRTDRGRTFNHQPAPGVGTGPVGPLFMALLVWLRRRTQKAA